MLVAIVEMLVAMEYRLAPGAPRRETGLAQSQMSAIRLTD